MSQSTSTAERAAAARREWPPWLSAVEALAMFALIVGDIWFVEPHRHGAWFVLAALAVASHAARGETPARLGFRTANLRACFVAVMPILLIAAALAVAFGVAFGTVRAGAHGNLGLFVVYYCIWGLFQQYALNGYFVNRLTAAHGRHSRAVPVAAAALFALAHVPNWFLTAVTFFAGWLCAHFYLKYRNLYPLGLAHGLLGTVLFLTVPEPITQHFYIGPGALKWQRTHQAAAHPATPP
jgi:hypothetical protein